MNVNRRESEQLRGASVSNMSASGGLPDEQTLRQEHRSEMIRKFSSTFNLDESEVREFLEDA